MKNSRAFYVDGKKIPIGDPFILRHNGKYFLYPSTEYPNKGIRCFSSTDLINFKFEGIVCDDPVTLNAYAPEVIYAYNKFYLCTSPGGNGHYIFVSDSPLGPFKRITENIQNMIDGSFFLDENHHLRFYRANHNGISMVFLDENGQPSKRENIHAPLYGWTEGPFMIYKDGFYYLTYCGNHLESKGYRIHYATSRSLDEDFRPSNQPLLISTKDEYCNLGHSSTVLAPDLDGYYLVYHHLFPLEVTEKGTRYTRNLCFDRLHFNGRMMSTTPTNFEIDDPKMPTLYEDLSLTQNQFDLNYPLVLSKIGTDVDFTSEFNFKQNGVILILSYQDNQNYIGIECENNKVTLKEIVNGNEKIIKEKELNLDFNYFHTVRVINGIKLEILVDNVPVLTFNKVQGGKIGYLTNTIEGIYFTAFSNYANGSSDLDYKLPLPSILDCKHDLNQGEFILEKDDIYSKILNFNESAKFNVISQKKANYLLSCLINSTDEARVEISTKNETKVVEITKTSTEYEFITKSLTFIDIDKEDEIKIKIIKGNLKYKAFFINEEPYISLDTLNLEDDSFVPTISESYYLRPSYVEEQSINFIYERFNKNGHFGLVFHATNFSVHDGQGDYGFYGYIVGFKNGLLTVDHVNYGLSRIYDKPIPLEMDKVYNLKATLKDSLLKVYLNDKLLFETTLDYYDVYGSCGVYQNEYAKVKLFGYNKSEAILKE